MGTLLLLQAALLETSVCTANQGSQQLLLSKSISCLNPFDLNSLRPVMAQDSELGRDGLTST